MDGHEREEEESLGTWGEKKGGKDREMRKSQVRRALASRERQDGPDGSLDLLPCQESWQEWRKPHGLAGGRWRA